MKRDSIAIKVSNLCHRFSESDFATIALSLLENILPCAGIAQSVAGEIAVKIQASLRNDVKNQYIEDEIKQSINRCIEKTIEALSQNCELRKDYIKDMAQGWSIIRLGNNMGLTIMDEQNKEIPYTNFYTIVLDENERERLKSIFMDTLDLYLFANSNLNAHIANKRINSIEKKLNQINQRFNYRLSSNQTLKAYELLDRMSKHKEEDGMINFISTVFERVIYQKVQQKNQYNIDTLEYLISLQEAYNSIYLSYNNDKRGFRLSEEELFLVIDLQRSTHLYTEKDLHIELYIAFICADIFFFQGDYDSAVEYYEIVRNKIEQLSFNPLFGRICQDALLYIDNSIGWSYHHLGRDQKSLKYYDDIEKQINQGNYSNNIRSFLSRYLRNGGVCLEALGRIEDAILKYERAIDILPEYTFEFKVYITYSSSIMKNWDIVYEKTTMKWLNNVVNNNHLDTIYPISLEMITRIKTYLSIASSMNSRFSDIYVQLIKVLVYEFMFDQKINKEKQFVVINENINIARGLSNGRPEYRYVVRDFYFMLYLMDYSGDRAKWLADAKVANNGLIQELANQGKKAGDTAMFAQMFDNVN